MLPRRHAAEDFTKFVSAVAREVNGLGEPSGQPRIGVDEAAHFVGVARDDHHDPVAMVFHELQERLDRFPAEIGARTGRAGQRVGLVDEKNASSASLHFCSILGAVCPI